VSFVVVVVAVVGCPDTGQQMLTVRGAGRRRGEEQGLVIPTVGGRGVDHLVLTRGGTP